MAIHVRLASAPLPLAALPLKPRRRVGSYHYCYCHASDFIVEQRGEEEEQTPMPDSFERRVLTDGGALPPEDEH